MIFRVSIEVPDSYDLNKEQIKGLLNNGLWQYAKTLDELIDKPTKTFNQDVKIFVGKV